MTDEAYNADSSASTATSESAPAQAATTESTAPALSTGETASPESSHTSATSASDSNTGSLETSNATTQSAQPSQKMADENWKNRYDSLRREQNKWAQQRTQYESQLQAYNGVDPNAVRAWQEAQTRAKQANLPKWDPQNPNRSSFEATKQKVETFRQAIRAAQTPEQRQAVEAAFSQTITQDEAQDFRAWEQHQQAFSARMAANPEAAIAEIIDRRVSTALGQWQQYQRADQQVGQWWDQNKALVDKHRDLIGGMLQQKVPWPVIQNYVTMQDKLDGLSSRVGEAEKSATAAKEQDRLLKSEASITKDPRSAGKIDLKALAKKRGITPGGPGWADLVFEAGDKGTI